MTARSVLRQIRQAVEAGRYRLAYHAEMEALPARGLTVDDVVHALLHATETEAQDDRGMKWKVYGPITNGDEYAVVILLLDGVVVITAHLPP